MLTRRDCILTSRDYTLTSSDCTLTSRDCLLTRRDRILTSSWAPRRPWCTCRRARARSRRSWPRGCGWCSRARCAAGSWRSRRARTGSPRRGGMEPCRPWVAGLTRAARTLCLEIKKRMFESRIEKNVWNTVTHINRKIYKLGGQRWFYPNDKTYIYRVIGRARDIIFLCVMRTNHLCGIKKKKNRFAISDSLKNSFNLTRRTRSRWTRAVLLISEYYWCQ